MAFKQLFNLTSKQKVSEDKECFSIAGNEITITNDKKKATNFCPSSYTVYGSISVATTNNNNTYLWNIKIDKIGVSGYSPSIAIGIQDTKLDKRGTNFFYNTPSYSYRSDSDLYVNSECSKVAGGFKEGDVVTVQLDMKAKTLNYLINNEDKGIIVNNIDHGNGLQYRLAITLRGEGSAVTLIDYAVKGNEVEATPKDDVKVNKNDDIYDRYDRLQNEMIKKITLIEQYENELKEKDVMIDELNKKVIELSVLKEEEKKLDDDNVGIEKVLSDLENEFIEFKQEYNGDILQEIFDKKPENLVNKESSLNKGFKKYKENMDKMVISSKSFNKYIQDIDGIISKLSKPDPTKYKSWNIKQILIWIQSLENGRFNKHINKLKHGLEQSEIIGQDLPDLTRSDLSTSPFQIGNFRDKKQLEMYFKSLKTQISVQQNEHVVDNEGAPTAYI